MEKDIKGIIQVIHGMSEHKERYLHFFNFFEKRGWKVIAENHIHHGELKKLEYLKMIFIK